MAADGERAGSSTDMKECMRIVYEWKRKAEKRPTTCYIIRSLFCALMLKGQAKCNGNQVVSVKEQGLTTSSLETAQSHDHPC